MRHTYEPLLKNRLFVDYWTGSTLVLSGVQFSWIALTWYVLQTTGSATKIGLIFAAYPIASMISSVMIGYLLDKYPRRALMAFDNMCQFALYLIIPILKLLNSLPFWTLVLLVVAAGCLSPLSQIGRGVILPNIVANEDLESANALSQIQMSFVTLFGPALGGVLVAMVGGAMTLVVTSICFLYYAMSLLWIPSERFSAKKSVSPTTERRAGDGRHSFIEGWMLLYRTPLLLLIVAVTLFFNLTYGPLEPAIPVMVSEIFHSGASVLGMIWSSFAVGALLGTFLWGRLRPKWSMRVVVSGVIFCWGICSCAMAPSVGIYDRRNSNQMDWRTLDHFKRRHRNDSSRACGGVYADSLGKQRSFLNV